MADAAFWCFLCDRKTYIDRFTCLNPSCVWDSAVQGRRGGKDGRAGLMIHAFLVRTGNVGGVGDGNGQALLVRMGRKGVMCALLLGWWKRCVPSWLGRAGNGWKGCVPSWLGWAGNGWKRCVPSWLGGAGNGWE